MSEGEPISAIKDYVKGDGPADWKHRTAVRFLYGLFDAYRSFLFSPKDETQLVMPQTLIAVDALRYDTLAAYRLTYNPNGLPFEIIVNALWIDRPRWELGETLLHETVHLFQEYMSGKRQERKATEKYQGCKSGYHNKQFVEISEELGLHPMLGVGAHWRPADGQFARLMELLEVERPSHADGDFTKPETPRGASYWWDSARAKTRGRSTLTLYLPEHPKQCAKQPLCKVRSGRKDLHLSCTDCGGVFVPEIG